MKCSFPTDFSLLKANEGSSVDLERIQNQVLQQSLEEMRSLLSSQTAELTKLRQTLERRTAVLSPTKAYSNQAYQDRFTSSSKGSFGMAFPYSMLLILIRFTGCSSRFGRAVPSACFPSRSFCFFAFWRGGTWQPCPPSQNPGATAFLPSWGRRYFYLARWLGDLLGWQRWKHESICQSIASGINSETWEDICRLGLTTNRSIFRARWVQYIPSRRNILMMFAQVVPNSFGHPY